MRVLIITPDKGIAEYLENKQTAMESDGSELIIIEGWPMEGSDNPIPSSALYSKGDMDIAIVDCNPESCAQQIRAYLRAHVKVVIWGTVIRNAEIDA